MIARLLSCFLFCFSILISAQTVIGSVTDEDQNPLPAVLVVNLRTDKKAYTDFNGQFKIEGSVNDELRFIRKGYDRNSKIIKSEDFDHSILLVIFRTPQEIEEVKVSTIKLTGDLNVDSKNLTKFDRTAQVQNAIGVPTAPEKPRETPPPTLEKVGVIKYALSNLNFNNLYKNISGDARRMRSLYRYEDLQDDIGWIRERVEDDYFTKMGIQKDKISEFLQFSMGQKPTITRYIKARNLSKILFDLEETFPKYLSR